MPRHDHFHGHTERARNSYNEGMRGWSFAGQLEDYDTQPSVVDFSRRNPAMFSRTVSQALALNGSCSLASFATGH